MPTHEQYIARREHYLAINRRSKEKRKSETGWRPAFTRWTTSEDEMLRQFVEENGSINENCTIPNRTIDSMWKRAEVIGLKLSHNEPFYHQPDFVEYLAQAYVNLGSVHEVQNMVGIDHQTVAKLVNIRKRGSQEFSSHLSEMQRKIRSRASYKNRGTTEDLYEDVEFRNYVKVAYLSLHKISKVMQETGASERTARKILRGISTRSQAHKWLWIDEPERKERRRLEAITQMRTFFFITSYQH